MTYEWQGETPFDDYPANTQEREGWLECANGPEVGRLLETFQQCLGYVVLNEGLEVPIAKSAQEALDQWTKKEEK